MGTVIVILILAVIVIFALKDTLKHMAGQGGCCGGAEPAVRRKKLAQIKSVKVMKIEGMHCENCKKRIENRLNDMEQVSAKVNLKKKEAKISLGGDVPEEELVSAVKDLGYEAVIVEAKDDDKA